MALPALMFTFVPMNATGIVCAYCHNPIDVSDGKPLAVWGLNNAPLHRACSDAYISVQGWEPAIMPGINIWKPREAEQSGTGGT